VTAAELAAAREWIADCVWGDLERAADIAALSDAAVERGIARHYSGGVAEFVAECE